MLHAGKKERKKGGNKSNKLRKANHNAKANKRNRITTNISALRGSQTAHQRDMQKHQLFLKPHSIYLPILHSKSARRLAGSSQPSSLLLQLNSLFKLLRSECAEILIGCFQGHSTEFVCAAAPKPELIHFLDIPV